MYLSVYAFWKGYLKSNHLKYMALAGLFLGLANDTKYAGFLLYPTYALFAIWYRKSLRSLLEKKVLVILVLSVIAFAPVVLALQANNMLLEPFYRILILRKQKPTITARPLSLDQIIVLGLDLYINTITGFPSVETSSLPWSASLQAATYILAPLAVLYSLTGLIRRKPAEAFLGILFVVFNGFIMVALPHSQSYLTWSLPAFDLILASFAVLFFRTLRSGPSTVGVTRRLSVLTPLKLAGIVLVTIIVASTALAGFSAWTVDKGECCYNFDTTGFLNSAQFIKKRAVTGELVAVDPGAISSFSPDLFGPVHPLVLFNVTAQMINGRMFAVTTLRTDLLEQLKPRFLLIYSTWSYRWISEVQWKTIRESYILVFQHRGWRIFERIVPVEYVSPLGPRPIVGQFRLKDLSSASIPPIMSLGVAYRMGFWVLSNDTQPQAFQLTVDAPNMYVLAFESDLTLTPNHSKYVNVTIVPQLPDVDSTIQIRLYLRTGSLPGDLELQDSVAKDVRLTRVFRLEDVLPIVIILIIAVAVLIMRGRGKLLNRHGGRQ
jgi:hypothetical protein